MAAYRSVFDYNRALTPDGAFMIVGGSMRTLLQVVLLGALLSRFGDKRLGINAWEPNKREDLAFLGELFEAGKVMPVIDKRYALPEIPEAFQYLGDGHALGKLVVVM